MALEDKLRQIYDRIETASRSSLQKRTRALAALVASVLREGMWGDVAARTDKALSDASDEARAHARLLDATGYIEEKVFAPTTARVVDLRLKYDLRAAQEQILQMFQTNEAPRRGFVYVAWCQKPETFYYVGKATSVDRLNLAAHGKLARATADATLLSLVFPSQSRDEILAGVEGSILAVVEAHTGRFPELNDRRERVVPHRGTQELRSLSAFLGDVAAALHRD